MKHRAPSRQQGSATIVLLGLLAVIGLILALLVLLLFTPAGAISMGLERSSGDARLLAPSGKIHRGSGQLMIKHHNWGEVSWQLRPARLLRGRLEADFAVRGPGYAAQAEASVNLDRQLVTSIEGQLTESGLRLLLAPYDIYPSGDFTFTGGHLEARRDRLSAVHGDGHWSGGLVRYFLAGQGWTVDFPPLSARLRLTEGQPLLVVVDPGGDPLLDVRLDLDGWAHLRIRYRFIALAGFPWPDGPEPDTILIELSERVF